MSQPKKNSFDMYHEYEASRRSGMEFKPSHVPLDFGKPFKPFPNAFTPYNFSRSLKWYFFPDLQPSLTLRFIIVFSAVVCVTLGFFLGPTALAASSTGLGVFAALLIIAGIVLAFMARNIIANENLRNSVCRVYAKHLDAVKLWTSDTGPAYESRDVFYKEKTFLGEFRVLRGGDVELGNREDPYTPSTEMKGSADAGKALQAEAAV